MNRIEELIEKLCPEGVEFKKMGEVGEFVRGSGLQKRDFTETGVGCIHYGQIYTYYGTYTDKTKSFVPPELAKKLKKASKNDLIIAGVSENIEDVCKAVVWLGEEDICISGDAFIFKHKQNPKFIGYLLQTERFLEFKKKYAQGAKVTRLQSGSLPKFEIPIPPLPIQNEIVKILDLFTQLEAELEAELEARKTQYTYYRDALLNFEGKEVEWKTLDMISKNLDSKRKPVRSTDRESGKYPYYGASGIVDYVIDYIFDGDYLLISEDGANLLTRNTPIAFSISGKTWVNNHAHVLQFDNYVTRRLVEIYLNSIDLSKYISGAAQPKLNKENLNKIPIPIPALSEQQRIVSILDKFDALVNDLSSGLPAEIQARRQQYEYYRNKLLTFKNRDHG